jgi:hypothetical protein
VTVEKKEGKSVSPPTLYQKEKHMQVVKWVLFGLFIYFVGMYTYYSIRFILDKKYSEPQFSETEAGQTIIWPAHSLFLLVKFLSSLFLPTIKLYFKFLVKFNGFYHTKILIPMRKKYEAYVWKKKNDAAFKKNAAAR